MVVGWLVGWLVIGGWWLVVGWLVDGCSFCWFVVCSWWLVGPLWAAKLLSTTWYHHFEPRKEVDVS